MPVEKMRIVTIVRNHVAQRTDYIVRSTESRSIAFKVDRRGKVITCRALQCSRMSQEFSKILIRWISWSPPRTDEAGDPGIGRPVHLSLNRTIIARVVLDCRQVRYRT